MKPEPAADYLRALSGQLAAVGVAGRLRTRIVAEIGDHLSCDPSSDLGPPDDLARRFADELGTQRARRAAVSAFAALAVAGAAFAAAFLASRIGGEGLAYVRLRSPVLGRLAAVITVVAAQVAFVAGLLAALRALRRRHDLPLARGEATIIIRRAAVGLAAGIASVAGLAAIALDVRSGIPSAGVTVVLVATSVGGVALLAAVPAVVRAQRLQPVAPGTAGNMFDDIGLLTPPGLMGRPWRCALTVAGALFVVIAVAGVAASDPFDGIARALADALACLAGFAVLGRYLGLRG